MNHHALDAAVQAVRSAAWLCRSVRQQPDFGTMTKTDRTPVTVADYGSQALVCRALIDAFPEIPIVGEEGADDLRLPENANVRDQVLHYVQMTRSDANSSNICDWIDLGAATPSNDRPFWTLDPIDGTKGFLRNEHYAVALALIAPGGILELAVMACPVLDALYIAVQGQGVGVLSLDNPNAALRRIQINNITDPTLARVCESVEATSTNHGAVANVLAKLGTSQAPVKLDSQVKYAVVAQGDAEVYLRISPTPDYREKIWDHAAGALIVAEAGGVVTDLAGKPFDFTQGRSLNKNQGVVVAAPAIHPLIIEAINI